METEAKMKNLIKKIQLLSPARLNALEDFIDFLNQRPKTAFSSIKKAKTTFSFPKDQLGSWPKGLSLSRGDLYDDNGR